MPVASTSAEGTFDAIIVAGATSVRLDGADKAMLDVGGKSLLDRALGSVSAARRTVVVGPSRAIDAAVVWCEERPVGGGPVAAFAAGLAAVDADVVVLLAVDLPFVAPAVPLLVAAAGDLAVLVDVTGRVNYLASAWRREVAEARLKSLLDPAGASMRALVSGVAAVSVDDVGGWSDDCDTWESLEAARTRAALEGI